MILEIDAGNTAIKWRVVNGGASLERGSATHERETWTPMLARGGALSRVRVSNVCGVDLEQELRRWVRQQAGLSIEVARSEPSAAGVTNGYREPEKLGVDRWLAVVAAWNTVGSPCVVVDAGTTVTVDFIGCGGRHLGGYIVPGEQMMYRALFSGTKGVRFDPGQNHSLLPGRDTGEAVENGCRVLIESFVVRSLAWFRENEKEATLVLTGGGVGQFDAAIRENARHIPDLVLDGLGYALP